MKEILNASLSQATCASFRIFCNSQNRHDVVLQLPSTVVALFTIYIYTKGYDASCLTNSMSGHSFLHKSNELADPTSTFIARNGAWFKETSNDTGFKNALKVEVF